ncbi:hypothetical protein KJ786_03740 [Patescibacteria group bacterium]|nr:hypothetical protein [Patescibacteria group bacterium]
MKIKKSLITLSLILVVLILPVAVLAQDTPPSGYALTGIIESLKTAVWAGFGIIATICFVIAGVLLLTSGNQPEKISSARSVFMWGIASVVAGILIYSIITLVQLLL